jgi:hypothetical protein
MTWVTCVQVRSNQRLYVEMQDGRSGEIDLSSEWWGLRELVLELRAPALFARVSVNELGELRWPNGACLSPDAVEEMLPGGQ